ncbi:unnamed protein product [Meganyctiphanes norvegica]|uniref:Ig-like domain-containing protein n=1 Tax=Meganyctiphanes norvegica TaxID=48144 RepID=A0AAV2RWR8_MEGNR
MAAATKDRHQSPLNHLTQGTKDDGLGAGDKHGVGTDDKGSSLGSSRWSLGYSGGGTGGPLPAVAINNTITNVTAQVGSSAFLPCRIGHLGDRQISWIRRRDWHVLTSADILYTFDQRFSVQHSDGTQDWTLQIKYVTEKDNGTYECQVSTASGIISLFVKLDVVTPEARILGQGQYHVNHGSPIRLTCIITKSPIPPQFINWYFNGIQLNYDPSRPEVKITTELPSSRGGISRSRLVVEHAEENRHAGNYSCSAGPHTITASTRVFITEGDKTAAVQRIDSSAGHRDSLSPFMLLLLLVATLVDLILR